MQLGARGAQRDRQATKKLLGYSKQWAPGDTMRVLLPLVWYEDGQPDFMVGQVWGHQVNDVKTLGLKTTFIPSLTEFTYDGKPVGVPDITYQFSRIAQIFVNGQCEAELARIAAKPWPSQQQRDQALAEVRMKYDTKNNRQAVKPIIGKARYIILCEPLSFKYIEGQGIVKDSIAVSTWALSDGMLTKLESLLLNPKFRPEQGAKFFEFEITYPTDTDKGISGTNAIPAGLTPEYQLQNKHPDDFTLVSSYFGSWSGDSELIKTRATTLVSEDAIQEAIKNYCLMNSEFLDAVENKDDISILTNNIEVVSKVINTKFLTNAELQATLNDAIAKFEIAKPVSTTQLEPSPEIPGNSSEVTTAPKSAEEQVLPDITNVAGAPTVNSLIGGSLGLGSEMDSEDILAGIDLTAMQQV